MNTQEPITLHHGDALVVVDVQNDFLPGGTLAVAHGDEVVPVLNQYLASFSAKKLPVFATRDWHPQDHCSFKAQGGPWPPHCVVGTSGASFSQALRLPSDVVVISKAIHVDRDAYSGFAGTDLAQRLHALKVTRVFVGGLATDYCVLNTVLDALKERFEVVLLTDAIRAVNARANEGDHAVEVMLRAGTTMAQFAAIL